VSMAFDIFELLAISRFFVSFLGFLPTVKNGRK